LIAEQGRLAGERAAVMSRLDDLTDVGEMHLARVDQVALSEEDIQNRVMFDRWHGSTVFDPHGIRHSRELRDIPSAVSDLSAKVRVTRYHTRVHQHGGGVLSERPRGAVEAV
jgi:hypothetical protein